MGSITSETCLYGVFGRFAFRHRTLMAVAAVFLLMMDSVPGGDLKVRVGPGGTGRFLPGRWGLAAANVVNRSDSDQLVTVVVTPRHGDGARFARTIAVPANSQRAGLWPVLQGVTQQRSLEFDILALAGDADSQTILPDLAGDLTDSFVLTNPFAASPDARGFTGHLTSLPLDDRDRGILQELTTAWRTQARQPLIAPDIQTTDAAAFPETLDGLDQLMISSTDLHLSPSACDSVRLWLSRGGRAIVFADLCSAETMAAILGDNLPFAIVDRTSLLHVPLTAAINEKLTPGTPPETQERVFEEPVNLVRMNLTGGHVLWSTSGWPVLVEQPFGNGTVYLVTMSPEILQKEGGSTEPDPVALQLTEPVFNTPLRPAMIPETSLATAARAKIGYEVPDRSFAVVVLLLFTAAVAGAAMLARRLDRPSLVIFSLPILAVLFLIPGVVKGNASRNSAPQTVVDYRVIQAADGQTRVSADGACTIYLPSPVASTVSTTDGILTPLPDQSGSTASAQRCVRDGSSSVRWPNFSQPAGLEQYRHRSEVQLPEPMKAVARLRKGRIDVSISNSDLLKPEDVILAGLAADRMALSAERDGTFSAGPNDVLHADQISLSRLLSEDQVAAARLYDTALNGTHHFVRFPAQPSVLFRTHHLPTAMNLEGQVPREESMTLMTVPLHLAVPEAGKPITIPSSLLPFRVLPDENRVISAAYSNSQQKWIAVNNGGEAIMRFAVPDECCPLEFSGADVTLRILAGSRTVKVLGGRFGQWTELRTLESPVGTFEISIPPELLNSESSDRGRSVWLKLIVSDLPNIADDMAFQPQDDTWKIERLMLTVHGQRQ
ncbi:MAG: hypothetical protein R3C49_08845 [Planctomycetaceae bacterium]